MANVALESEAAKSALTLDTYHAIAWDYYPPNYDNDQRAVAAGERGLAHTDELWIEDKDLFLVTVRYFCLSVDQSGRFDRAIELMLDNDAALQDVDPADAQLWTSAIIAATRETCSEHSSEADSWLDTFSDEYQAVDGAPPSIGAFCPQDGMEASDGSAGLLVCSNETADGQLLSGRPRWRMATMDDIGEGVHEGVGSDYSGLSGIEEVRDQRLPLEFRWISRLRQHPEHGGDSEAPSRGKRCRDFSDGGSSARDYVDEALARAQQVTGYGARDAMSYGYALHICASYVSEPGSAVESYLDDVIQEWANRF